MDDAFKAELRAWMIDIDGRLKKIEGRWLIGVGIWLALSSVGGGVLFFFGDDIRNAIRPKSAPAVHFAPGISLNGGV